MIELKQSGAKRPRVFYGWWLVLASIVAMAVSSGLSFWSYGLYVSPLEEEFGWSRAAVSLGFSFALLFSGGLGPLVGMVIDRRGPRFSIVLGAVLTSGGYLLLASTSALWQWYLFNSILAVFRQMMFFMPFQALVSRWFDVRRGVALTMVSIGFSLGGLLVLPIVGMVMDTYGWDGALIFSSILTVLVLLPIGLFVVRDSPAAGGDAVDGRMRQSTGSGAAHMSGVPLSKALRSPVFWLTAFGFGFLFFGIFGWSVHQIPFWESKGYSRETAALIVAVPAGLGIGFRLGFGLVADRVRRYEYVGAGLCTFFALSAVLLLVDTTPAAIGIFIGLWTIGSGATLIESLLIARSFGITHFATILGSFLVIETVFQIASPTVAGLIFDSTGSYDAALVMFAVAFVMASVMFAAASRFPRPLEKFLSETRDETEEKKIALGKNES